MLSLIFLKPLQLCPIHLGTSYKFLPWPAGPSVTWLLLQTLFTSSKCACSWTVSSVMPLVFCHSLLRSLPSPYHDFIWLTPTYSSSPTLSFLREHWRLDYQIQSIQAMATLNMEKSEPINSYPTKSVLPIWGLYWEMWGSKWCLNDVHDGSHLSCGTSPSYTPWITQLTWHFLVSYKFQVWL